jgi:acetyl esterase/lipase
MKKSFTVFVTGLTFFLLISPLGCQSQATSSSQVTSIEATGVNPERLGKVDKDIVYGSGDFIPLKMDIYYPKVASGIVPAIVYVHGGGWIGGDKSDIPSGYVTELVSRGYLVVSVNYRLAPQYKFPAQIEDVKCAVRFLRANAGNYGIDITRIGAMGESAGGHLVSLLGVTDNNVSFEGTGGWKGQSSRVGAVVDLYGPADLNALFTGAPSSATVAIFGASDSKTLAADSPVSYIISGNPPFLILQGDQDSVVPPSQSQAMYDLLVANNVPASLVIVKNAGHSFTPVGGPIVPSLADITRIVADFFDHSLKSA